MGLRHRSIRLRVGILIAVPVLCLMLLYAITASITLGNSLSQTRAKSIKNQLADPISAFEQQLAEERGLALLNLANPYNSQLSSELALQEAATGKALSNMEAALRTPAVTRYASQSETTAIKALLKQTSTLYFLRGNVTNAVVSMPAAVASYDAVLNAANNVLDTVIAAQASVPLVTQALDILNAGEAGQTMAAEADLLNADMAQRRFPEADRLTIAALAGTRQQLVSSALPSLSPSYGAPFAKYLTPTIANAAAQAEQTVLGTPWRVSLAPATVVDAGAAFTAYSVAMGKALAVAEAAVQQALQQQAGTAQLQLLLAVGIGLLALITSIALSLILGRGLIRQLRELRESALTLAHEKLPEAIRQLRAGEPVDVDDYAPAGVSTGNEIEQVQHAFGLVQRAAVQSAVDEARLRRGISDVFRNLAGRSQSLLHRQLTLLDGMERRATEPEQLEDLFRIDHLTTRMRRHAEGLIILSGDTPSRGWRQPVPLVDVLRAAVAEVEDYTRVRVLCRTGAAVAGHAVADVIHLLAELAENATVFSPPNTPVRMQGDIVGRGFAIEIEDRGLGISQARLDEINANLAHPPQFDLSGSDRLGLFIAGQLARRHDIKVTLRPSVYGGTTAIVLLPTALVVEENTFEPDPVLPAGQSDRPPFERIGGRHAAMSAISAGNTGGFGGSSSRENGNGLAAGNGHVRPAAEPARSPSGSGFTFGQPATSPPSGGANLPTQPFGSSSRGNAVPEPLRLAAPVSEEVDAAQTAAAAELTELGLPVRVRQASLAPQLRDTSPAGAPEPQPVSGGFSLPTRRPSGSFEPARAEPASPDAGGALASPEAARNTMSALQRGWQLGRAEASLPEPPTPTPPIETDDGDED